METYNPKAQKMSSQIFPSPDISLNNEKYFFGYSRIGNWTQTMRVEMNGFLGSAKRCACGNNVK